MKDLDFWFFWDVFRKHWLLLFFVSCLAGMAAWFVSFNFIPKTYRSTVSLYFGKVSESSRVEKMLNDGLGGGLSETATELTIGNQLAVDYQEFLKSSTVIEGVQDELAKLGRWANKPYAVSTEQGKASRILAINIDSAAPDYSQEVANIYANVFIGKAQQITGIQNVRIIAAPTRSDTPISPNIPRNTVAGAAGGLFLTFLALVIFRLLDRTIHTPEEVENALNVPVVGTLHEDTAYIVDKKQPILFDGRGTGEASKGKLAEERNQLAEDFRVFRVNLINRRNAGQETGSVVAVTSSHAKEGKTFCTANLGAALAEAGYKVLLIDCDNGGNGLQSYFGQTNEKGLMDILSNDVDFDSTVKRNFKNLNMDVLFCGNQKVNSANLMISPKFRELVGQLKKEYDFAFLDVSCHLGTADIVSAGSAADSVLLLVRAGKTEGAVAKQTVEALKRANLDISGVILNGVEEE